MSLTKPRETGAKNPSKKYIEWKGGRLQGFFQYYDKETKKNIHFEFPQGVIILDHDLFSITGFNDPLKANVISNEVRTIHDNLVVKEWKDSKSRVILQGPYSSLKSNVSESKILKYTRSVYAMDIATREIVHFKLHGRSFAEFKNGIEDNPQVLPVVIKEVKEGVQGNVEYKYPTFGYLEEINEDDLIAAQDLDSKILQPYLEGYLAKNADPNSSNNTNHSEESEEFNSDNWRQLKLPSGVLLGTCSPDSFYEMKASLIDSGDVDSIQFECVQKAIAEYNNAVANWKDKTTRDGRKLGSLPFEELSSMLTAINAKDPMHPSKMYVMAGINEILESQQGDDDEIPF